MIEGLGEVGQASNESTGGKGEEGGRAKTLMKGFREA